MIVELCQEQTKRGFLCVQRTGHAGDHIDALTSIPFKLDSSVKPDSTPKPRAKRPRRDVETMEYLAAARRFIRRAGERVGESDEFELAELAALSDAVADALAVAVKGQQSFGKSWAKIGGALGITREAAWQRWGKS